MMPPGKVQISGFCDTDNYTDVITKGAKGLHISANPESLKLLVSGGLVSNCPLQDGKEWTLGQYTIEIGGVQIRSKKIFGIYNPPYIPESVSCVTIATWTFLGRGQIILYFQFCPTNLATV